jgi:hypothetical protein
MMKSIPVGDDNIPLTFSLSDGFLNGSTSPSLSGGSPQKRGRISAELRKAFACGVYAKNFSTSVSKAVTSFRVSSRPPAPGDPLTRSISLSASVTLGPSQSLSRVPSLGRLTRQQASAFTSGAFEPTSSLAKSVMSGTFSIGLIHDIPRTVKDVSTLELIGLLSTVSQFTAQEMHHLPTPIDTTETEEFVKHHPELVMDLPAPRAVSNPFARNRGGAAPAGGGSLVPVESPNSDDTESGSDDADGDGTGADEPSMYVDEPDSPKADQPLGAEDSFVPKRMKTSDFSAKRLSKARGASTKKKSSSKQPVLPFLELPKDYKFLDDFIEAEVYKLVLEKKKPIFL